MTAKHQHPEYRKNARIIRQNVARRRRNGQAVTCWRCGTDLDPEQTFDVGHIDPDAGHSLENLAPEHRYKSGRCLGNRAAGGRLGRQLQAQRRRPTASAPTTSTGVLGW